MIHIFSHGGRWAQLRAPLLALAVLASACESSDHLATTAPSDPTTDAAFESVNPPAAVASMFAAVSASYDHASYRGVAYGPIGLWKSSKSMSWGPQPFTGTQNYTDARGILTQLRTARLMKHRLVLAMTGGPSTRYTTNGKFDFTKWKNKMDTFNTPEIKEAVAAGVAIGTIVGNQLIDEPETRRWGGDINKQVIDQMAAYAKAIFPTLPMGVNHGPPGYRWRSSERFQVLDYVLYQYNHWVTSGNVAAWRDQVLAQARQDGVSPAFSLNILDGGVQDRDREYNCTGRGQAGMGTYRPNCRMTSDQMRDWGRALGVAGCTMQMWRFDEKYMSNSANQRAFRDLASLLGSQAPRSCGRPEGADEDDGDDEGDD